MQGQELAAVASLVFRKGFQGRRAVEGAEGVEGVEVKATEAAEGIEVKAVELLALQQKRVLHMLEWRA